MTDINHRLKNADSYSFSSKYINIKNINIHYVDEGRKEWPTILLLHGIPTWSFTFRDIIPDLLEEEVRCIAPDLPGFGYSECINKKAYSLQEYRDLVIAFIKKTEVNPLFIYGNDWGAVIALLLMADVRLHIKGVAVSNGYLPLLGQKIPFRFRAWMWFTRFSPVLPVSKIINTASITSLSDETKKMYEVPFRNKRKTAIRRLPNILPLYEKHIEASLSNAVWEKLRQSNIPLLTIFSSNDPYTAEGAILLQEKIPGSSGESHTKLLAGHFITEDAPTELANCISGFINKYRDDK